MATSRQWAATVRKMTSFKDDTLVRALFVALDAECYDATSAADLWEKWCGLVDKVQHAIRARDLQEDLLRAVLCEVKTLKDGDFHELVVYLYAEDESTEGEKIWEQICEIVGDLKKLLEQLAAA